MSMDQLLVLDVLMRMALILAAVIPIVLILKVSLFCYRAWKESR